MPNDDDGQDHMFRFIPLKEARTYTIVVKDLFVCLFVYLFILGRKLNRQNCLLKDVLREREEKD